MSNSLGILTGFCLKSAVISLLVWKRQIFETEIQLQILKIHQSTVNRWIVSKWTGHIYSTLPHVEAKYGIMVFHLFWYGTHKFLNSGTTNRFWKCFPKTIGFWKNQKTDFCYRNLIISGQKALPDFSRIFQLPTALDAKRFCKKKMFLENSIFEKNIFSLPLALDTERFSKTKNVFKTMCFWKYLKIYFFYSNLIFLGQNALCNFLRIFQLATALDAKPKENFSKKLDFF